MNTDRLPQSLRRLLAVFHVDFRPVGRPSTSGLLFAIVVAIVGSLLADYLLVRLGVKVFPSTRGFVHFQFSDYAKLTIIGVVIACIGWPIVAKVSSRPRWLFALAAVVVTLVLFLPDLWIWHQGSPAKAVFVLMWMHVAIALVTYYSLVLLAPVRRPRRH